MIIDLGFLRLKQSYLTGSLCCYELKSTIKMPLSFRILALRVTIKWKTEFFSLGRALNISTLENCFALHGIVSELPTANFLLKANLERILASLPDVTIASFVVGITYSLSQFADNEVTTVYSRNWLNARAMQITMWLRCWIIFFLGIIKVLVSVRNNVQWQNTVN